MQNIFYGMLLTFLNFSFTSGNIRIGLLPDFLGYMFILKGVEELTMESGHFTQIKLYIKLMIGYTLSWYIMDFVGMSSQINGVFNVGIGIIFASIAMYIWYHIIMGISEIEKRVGFDLKAGSLYGLWKVRIVCTVLAYLTAFIPGLVLIAVMIGFIVNIYFLIEFYHSKDLYYKLKSTK